MFRSSMFVGMAILGLALLVGSVGSQEKKDKPKAFLPPGFKDLKLTAAQEEKVRAIGADFKAKIEEATKKVKDLGDERNRAQFGVLTAEQKSLYLKNKTGEEPKKSDSTKTETKAIDK